jgi:hypothetical protein
MRRLLGVLVAASAVAGCVSAPPPMPSVPFLPLGTEMLPLETEMRTCPDPTGRIAVVRADPAARIQALFPGTDDLAGFIERDVPLVVAVYPVGAFGGQVVRRDRWTLCIEGAAGDTWTAGFASAPWTGSPLLVLQPDP